MAFADDIHSIETGLVRRMRATFDLARTEIAKRREFNRTYAELSRLSDRELGDLGLNRSNIASVARSAIASK